MANGTDLLGVEKRIAIVRQAVVAAVRDNQADVHEVIRLGQAGSDKVLDAARAGMRDTSFLVSYYTDWRRFRNEAREANKIVLAGGVGNEQDLTNALLAQWRAVALDPYDIEIAGNLGYYYARRGDAAFAYQLAIYALSLPRSPQSEGRTQDWQLLGAMSALLDRPQDAQGAFAVSLAWAVRGTARSKSALEDRLANFCKSLQHHQEIFGAKMDGPVKEIFKRANALSPRVKGC